MNKKRIFSSEFKLEKVLKYTNNHQFYVCISKEMGVDHCLIRRWFGLYKSKGILGFELSKTKTIRHTGLGAGTGTTGMIAFGKIARGAAAALTGGNFWQRAVTGLVVSGLNHAMHKIQTNRNIDKRLVALGKNPDNPAQIEQSELGGFAEDMFPYMMKQADDPAFLLKDKIVSPNGEAAYGQTVAANRNGVTSASHIEISRSALSSWHTLASTIGHELNHYVFFNTGVYDKWVRKFGSLRADALNENKAHYWEQKFGGSPDFKIMNNTFRIFKAR